MERVDFSHAMKRYSKKNRSLIIGNGFGIAYDISHQQSNFEWSTLVENSNICKLSPLYKVIENSNFDFELAQKKLNDTREILDTYSNNEEFSEECANEIEKLKEGLILSVTKSHPKNFAHKEKWNNKKSIAAINNCRDFIKKFDRVFSLNYDLLLYWVWCHNLEDDMGSDSFRRRGEENLTFIKSKEAKLLFPHGALHLIKDGLTAKKISSNETGSIISSVKNNIANGKFPLFVSEGTGEEKKKVILENEYLKHSYEQISKIKNGGVFFTFGCSFKENKDDHIIEAMMKSPADVIVIGEHNPSTLSYHRLQHTFEKIQSAQKNRRTKEIVIADTSNISIW